MSEHNFLVMWDCNGLECVIDITEQEQMRAWAQLQGQDGPSMTNLNMLVLRARYNSQRHYEIYAVTAQEGITREDIAQMFEDSPQIAADTIRRLGRCIHSDRVDKSEVKIV